MVSWSPGVDLYSYSLCRHTLCSYDLEQKHHELCHLNSDDAGVVQNIDSQPPHPLYAAAANQRVPSFELLEPSHRERIGSHSLDNPKQQQRLYSSDLYRHGLRVYGLHRHSLCSYRFIVIDCKSMATQSWHMQSWHISLWPP